MRNFALGVDFRRLDAPRHRIKHFSAREQEYRDDRHANRYTMWLR